MYDHWLKNLENIFKEDPQRSFQDFQPGIVKKTFKSMIVQIIHSIQNIAH